MNLSLENIIRIMAKSYGFRFTEIQPPFSDLEDFDGGLRKTLNPEFDYGEFGRLLLEKLPPATIIRTIDEFNCVYGIIRPREAGPAYLIGPVIRTLITEESEKRICSQYGQRILDEFMRIYQKIPVEYDTSNRDFLINLYKEACPCQGISLKEIPNFLPFQMLRDWQPEQPESIDYLNLQEKSGQELRLMEAIVAGDSQQALHALDHLEDFTVSDTFEDRYLSLKNQVRELNAVCRYVLCTSQKVSQLSVLQIHKNYAMQIRSINSVHDAVLLIRQMVLDYCNCANDEPLLQYSPLIRRVIVYIQQEFASPLSLRTVAEVCNINASYLSNLFRTETGITLTEYINHYRIQKSLSMLKHTQMSIAQVSESVGFLDENYYARIFKKIMGITPKSFRKEQQK